MMIMVEKIMVSPQAIRGYGNVVEAKDPEDLDCFRCRASADSEAMNGVEEGTFVLSQTSAPSLSIASMTAEPVAGRAVRISAAITDEEGNALVGKELSLRKEDDVLGTVITGQENAIDIVLGGGTHQLHAVFDGDEDYPPSRSESIQVVPARSFWDVEHEFDELEYSVGDDVLLTGTVGTLYDEIVKEEIITSRLLESGVRVMLYLGSPSNTMFCNTDSRGRFEFQVPNVQTNGFRIVIGVDDRHRVFNQVVPVPVHDYRIAIAESEISTADSTVLVVGLTDFNAEVEGATVAISGSDGSSYTCVTDSMGEARVNVGHLHGTVTFTATYQNVSSSVSVTCDMSFDITYVLDSNTPITAFNDFEDKAFTTVPAIEDEAFVVNYGRGYGLGMLSQGWDNTVDWTFECDFMQNNWDSHMSIFLGLNEHYNDYAPYSRLQLSSVRDRLCGKAGVQNSSSVSVRWASPSYTANAWANLVVEKRDGKYVTVKLNGTTIVNNVEWTDLLDHDVAYVGGASWWNSNGSSNPSGVRIKNIHISSYRGD